MAGRVTGREMTSHSGTAGRVRGQDVAPVLRPSAMRRVTAARCHRAACEHALHEACRALQLMGCLDRWQQACMACDLIHASCALSCHLLHSSCTLLFRALAGAHHQASLAVNSRTAEQKAL